MKGKIKKCRIESDGGDLFIVADGVRIAKRGRPGTPQARTWVSLEPGWSVAGGTGDYIDVIYEGQRTRIH
jgi:hypothetical protein